MVELLKVIKFEGDKDTLVWKHPAEDFNTHSKLIVHESQVAIFYKDGKALDEFGPGKYTLETGNIPILRALIDLPTEGVSQFHCEVYFINKATSLNVIWGTSSRFPVIEPTFQIPINVGASGAMDIVIDDAKKFMVNVVGTQTFNTIDQVTDYFKGKITTKVKNYLSKIMSEVSYYNITQHLEEISEALHEKLKEDFKEYGTLGFNWADERMADVAKKYAENPGNKSGVNGMVTGFTMAMAFGQMLGNNVGGNMSGGLFAAGQNFGANQQQASQEQQPVSNEPQGDAVFCTKCGNKLVTDAMFCSKCGTKLDYERESRERKEKEAFLDLSTLYTHPSDKAALDTYKSHHD